MKKFTVLFGSDLERSIECGSFAAAVTRAHVLASVASVAACGPVAIIGGAGHKFVIDSLPSLRGSVRVLSRVSA